MGSDRIADYAGLVTRSPVLAVTLALALIALVGVPPTSIFIAKLYIFTAAVKADLTWLAIIGVINSVVSAYYYIRIVRVMFLQSAEPTAESTAAAEERPSRSPAPWIALGIAGASMLFIGIAPGFVMEAARSAVSALTV